MEQARWKEDLGKCQNRSIPLPSLRKIRQSRGLSQRELAKLAGVSSGTVFRLENALRGAYPLTVRKLAYALGVPPVELVRGHRRE